MEELYYYPDDPRRNTIYHTKSLFKPFDFHGRKLEHRIALAPMTRSRAGIGRVPNDMMALYYTQRARAAMIVTEATIISEQGAGYAFTPGIYNEEQIAGWKKITDVVHDNEGLIFCQLWHCGRISHPDLQPGHKLPVAPSAIKPGEHAGKAFTEDGFKPFMVPRALETDEVAALVQDYVRASQSAIEAGFDGVEIHAANGYLLNQFLSDKTNQRTDQYGGSLENRARLLLEVVDAVSSVIGAERVGVRISPWGLFLDCHDSSPGLLYSYVVKQLNERWLSYLSVVEREWMGETDKVQDDCPPSVTAFIRQYFKGTIITAGGYDKVSAAAMVESSVADLVAFGKHYLANPDLPRRLYEDAPLNAPDESTFYGGDERGYTDYPYLSE